MATKNPFLVEEQTTGNPFLVEEPSLPESNNPFLVDLNGQGFRDFSGEEYGPSALLNDPEKFAIVDRFMASRYGVDDVDKYSNEEKVDKFLNTMRYFDSGNTVQTVLEVDHILSGDEQTRAIYGEAMNLYQGLGGITSDEYTWGETFDAVRDYALGVIVDPVNVIAPVVGKAFAAGGTRGVAKFAQRMATREFTRQTARGAAPRVAQAAANRVRGAAIQRYNQNFGRQMAVKEAVGAGITSVPVSVGVDLAYQHGLIQTGNREEISALQTGLAALGGLVAVGVDVGVQSLRGVSKLPTTITSRELSVRDAGDLAGVLGGLAEEMRKAPRDRMKRFFEGFSSKVARGEELPLKDSDFFIDLIMGNDDLGFKGLAPILQEKGFMWRGPRGVDDNFSNWLGDAIRHAPQTEVVDFTKAFEEVSGITVTDLMRNTGRTVKDLRRGAAEVLADNMAAKLSNAGRVFNAMSRASKLLGGKRYTKVTADDYATALFDKDLARLPTEEATKVSNFFGKVGEGFKYFQNTYIRMLVTHPGTSVLNVKGWATKSAMQSAADLVRGTVVYGGGAALKGMRFMKGSAASDWTKLTGVYKANARRVLNTLDPYTTHDSFKALVGTNPERFKDLMNVQAGGVVKRLGSESGIEGNSVLAQKIDGAVDFMQRAALVHAQDALTKSQEFMYNLDVLLRESDRLVLDGKRMTAIDLLNRDDLHVLINTKAYREVEAKAIDRTLENIMSKSYAAPFGKSGTALQEVADVIERARNIPVIGIQVPFGRFFNNVVATMSEFTGLTGLLKPMMRGVGENKSYAELASKAAVFWTAVGLMVNKESEYIDRGVAFNESIDEATGQRVDVSYDSPDIAFKAAARILAHRNRGENAPEDLVVEANKLVFGQLTRNLVGAEQDISNLLTSAISGDLGEAWRGVVAMTAGSASTAMSGMTRFLEPLNATISLSKDPEDYVVRDFNRTGNTLYKSLRYVDAVVDSFINLEALPKAAPLESQTSRESGRLFGYRNLSPLTAGSRVFAMIGRPDWDAGIQADVPEARNFFTQVFQPIFEVHAQRLLNSEAFLNAGLEGKTLLVRRALEEARSSTHSVMANSPKLQDARMEMLFKLTANRKVGNLEGFMQELGIETDNIMDLSLEQLQLLDFFISDEENRVERQIYNR